MSRLTLALASLLCVVCVASASLSPPRERSRLANKVAPVQYAKLSPEIREVVDGRGSTPEFVLTDRTEVRLNGKPCNYEEIPHHATIVLIEVAMDNRTILKIHFRTGK
jgi:hypothetical protein